LDLLILNAGIMAIPTREPTKQGFESQIGVNHLAQFLLTSLLLDALKSAGSARIVVLSSSAANRPQNFDFLDDEKLESKKYDPWIAYGNSKLSNVLFARELDEPFKSFGIRAFSVHPGVILTNLANRAQLHPIVRTLLLAFSPFAFKSIPQGASTTMYCAVHPEAVKNAGQYFINCNPGEIEHDEWPEDANIRKKLWDRSVQLTGARF
jgi:NAD(P)-dependent dehydrogenase (short-subunit alcohol dehydrogenase family)